MSSSSQTSTSLNFNGNISLTSSTPYVQTALTYSIFDNELIYSVAQNVFTKSEKLSFFKGKSSLFIQLL